MAHDVAVGSSQRRDRTRPWSAVIPLPVGEGPPWEAEVYLPTGDGDPWKLAWPARRTSCRSRRPGNTHVVSLPGVAAVKGVTCGPVLLTASLGNGSPGAMEDFAAEEIDVRGPRSSEILGSEIGNDVQEIADTNVALRHCAGGASTGSSKNYWIADMGLAHGDVCEPPAGAGGATRRRRFPATGESRLDLQ